MIRIALFLSFFSFACNAPTPPILIPAGSVQRTIQLEGLDAELHIYLPAEMDSTATWAIDCCTGGGPTQGFWDRGFQIIQARHGLCFDEFTPDSIRQVAVSYNGYPVVDSLVINESYLNESLQLFEHHEWSGSRRKLNILFKGVEKCGHSDIAFFAFNGFTVLTPAKENGLPCETLSVLSTFKDDRISINFECVGSDCTGFAAKMLSYARTLEFKDMSKPEH